VFSLSPITHEGFLKTQERDRRFKL